MKDQVKSSIAKVSIVLFAAGLLLLSQSAIARQPVEQGPSLPAGAEATNAPSAPLAPAAPSSTVFSYQGQLLDAAGDPLNGRADMSFALYHQPTGGAAFWSEAYTGTNAITVTEGLFYALLGSQSPIAAANLTDDLYLELTVYTETLAPRELLTSVAYAVEADTLAAGATTRGTLTVPGNLIVNGNVGIGTANPNAKLHLSALGNTNNGIIIDNPDWGPSKARIFFREGGSENYGGVVGYDAGADILYLNTLENSVEITGIAIYRYNGNVGIGTTSPEYRLDVVGGWRLSASGGSYMWSERSDSEFDIQGAGTSGKRLLSIHASPTGTQGDLLQMFGHDGTSYIQALMVSNPGDVKVGRNLHLGGADLIMDEVSGRGGGRAMVNDNSDTLTINYAGDFAGGVSVQSNVNLNGHTIANCGALVEANLQTEGELEAGKIERFSEGDVLCWSPEAERLEKCAAANDRLVQAIADSQGRPIVIGAELVKVIGPVQAGDYLVSSGVPGYAMASPTPTFGIVIAQALQDFNGERGLIKAMIRKM